MKKYVIMVCIIIFVSINFLCVNSVHALPSITDDDFTSEFNPNNISSNDEANTIADPIVNSIISIVNPILSILQVLGVLLMAVSIGIFGYQRILSVGGGFTKDLGLTKAADQSPDVRIQMMNLGRGLLIGSIILFSSTTITKLVLGFFM